MTPLTKRQKEVLDAIAMLTHERGYAPTFKELAHALGITSLAAVAAHINNLESKGYLARNGGGYRNIQVLPAQVCGLKSCAEGHALCYFSGACPACGMKGAA